VIWTSRCVCHTSSGVIVCSCLDPEYRTPAKPTPTQSRVRIVPLAITLSYLTLGLHILPNKIDYNAQKRATEDKYVQYYKRHIDEQINDVLSASAQSTLWNLEVPRMSSNEITGLLALGFEPLAFGIEHLALGFEPLALGLHILRWVLSPLLWGCTSCVGYWAPCFGVAHLALDIEPLAMSCTSCTGYWAPCFGIVIDGGRSLRPCSLRRCTGGGSRRMKSNAKWR
jgi:hypothetical protein